MTIKEATKLKRAGREAISPHVISREAEMPAVDAGLTDSHVVDGQISLATTRIDTMAYRSSFQPGPCRGNVPVNISLFTKDDFINTFNPMKKTFKVGLCVSELVALTYGKDGLVSMIIPPGKIGLITVSQIVLKGALLKAGIPVDARFGGIIEIKNGEPLRFVDLIEYSSSSFDPSELFIAAGMTSVKKAASEGNGKILASFWEIPSSARPKVAMIIQKLEKWGIKGLLKLGKEGEPICETPMRLGRAGMIVTDGLNPVAAATEAGATVINHATSGLIDFSQLRNFYDSCAN